MCGIVGIAGFMPVNQSIYDALTVLQHRGQDAAGIITIDANNCFRLRKANGLVNDVFEARHMQRLQGNMGIGHVRYPTAGSSSASEAQPFYVNSPYGITLAHNGNLTNALILREELKKRGCIFAATSDTETIIHLIAISEAETLEAKLIDALKQIKGAYSLVLLTDQGLIGVRDPNGVRPLVMGKLGDSYILASETCALDIIGADYVRDIKPGEIVFITGQGERSIFPFVQQQQRFCIFEYVYFSRPDSVSEGHNVYRVRKRIGAELARENKVDADIVVPVPDSGVPGALGYAEAAGIPFELGIIRNHYVGRTFIEPTDQVRNLGVKLKHNANDSIIKGKKVVLVDDSIVRGTTSKKIVSMIRDAGATEVHMRIASPPTTNSCYYGVDTPERSKLMAANYSIEEMCKLIGADSLSFISIEGLYRAVSGIERDAENPQYCDACFTGNYPIELSDYTKGIKAQRDFFSVEF